MPQWMSQWMSQWIQMDQRHLVTVLGRERGREIEVEFLKMEGSAILFAISYGKQYGLQHH